MDEKKAIVISQSRDIMPRVQRALPVVGTAATLVWLGQKVVTLLKQRQLSAPREAEIVPQEEEKPTPKKRGYRVVYRFYAEWSVEDIE